jgi:hypothetical protein
MKIVSSYYLSLKATLVGAFCLGGMAASGNQATASTVLYEELFTVSSAQSMSGINWSAYGDLIGGTSSVDISDVPPSNTLYVGPAAGNPASPIGYLASIMGNPDTGSNVNRYPTYATYESGLSLDLDGTTVTWRMNASSGSTFRVRLLIMVDGAWYVSNTSDAATEYYTPTTYGTGADFAAASVEEVEKTFVFTTDASSWRTFTLEEGGSISVGSILESDLSSTNITAIGFYILGGGTGRLDTLQVTAIPEASTSGLILALSSLLMVAVCRQRVQR